MVKRWLTPQYERPGSHLDFFKRFYMCIVKRWLTSQYDRPGSHLDFFKRFYMCIVKRWLTPQYDRPGSHLEFFLKDSTCTWSKDDWPSYDRPGSHLEFFFKRFNMHMVKRWLTLIWQTRISLEFFFKDSTCAWSKMIDCGGDCYTKDLLPAMVTTCCMYAHLEEYPHWNRFWGVHERSPVSNQAARCLQMPLVSSQTWDWEH